MFQSESFNQMKYLIKFPEDYSSDKKYPALIFMHGAGTKGNNLDLVKANPFFKITEKHQNFPFIVFAPQCHTDTWFDIMETVNAFVEYVSKKEYVDSQRVCLMGASMGGYAVWQMAMGNPSLFAAIVPICGGGMYWNARRIAKIPIWAFHGDSDSVVKPEESEKMVNTVNKVGGDAKLTLYKDCGHDAWSQTYSNAAVFEWLLSQKNSGNSIEGSEFNDSKIYG